LVITRRRKKKRLYLASAARHTAQIASDDHLETTADRRICRICRRPHRS
jgi:hypothetical protein